MDSRPRPTRWTALWVATTYFAEGLPLWTVRNLASVYLTDIGAREAYLGFLNFLNLPWNLKFLWSPAVDLWGTKRGWLLKVEAIVTLLIGAIGVLTVFGPAPVKAGIELDMAGSGMDAVNAILALLVALAFLAATHDVCIDGYYMEAITDPGEQAAYTGLRVLTHRLARFFANGLLVAVAGWFTWAHGFLGAAAAMALLYGFHWAYLPRCETVKKGHGWKQNLIDFGRAFLTYLDQPGIVLGLLFVVTYKLGDEVLFSMNTPFLMRELWISKEDDLPWINGIVAPLSSIAGSMVSAWAIKRWGLRKAIWPLTLGMNLNIWAYVGLAWMAEQTWVAGTVPLPEIWEVAFVVGYEQFAAGLGAAVLVVYIMRTCKAEFKAAHYAVASAIASLGGTMVGGFGGIVVEATGYVVLFVTAFAAALPSMILLGFLKIED